MYKALIVRGGWEGHEPVQVSEIFASALENEGFEVEISDSLDAFLDLDKLMGLSLIVPAWTMGKITNEQCKNVLAAVESGVGVAGCHGGMCDAFRESTDWQFMTGGQWVAHPGNDGTPYRVHMKGSSSFITEGIGDFDVVSEQYYLHVDPCVEVLATTRFPVADGPHAANGQVDVPVVWTKRWGKGRVFYNSLGHHADVFQLPEALELMVRGFLWAAKDDEDADDFFEDECCGCQEEDCCCGCEEDDCCRADEGGCGKEDCCEEDDCGCGCEEDDCCCGCEEDDCCRGCEEDDCCRADEGGCGEEDCCEEDDCCCGCEEDDCCKR